MLYYIVGLIDTNSYDFIEKIQKYLSNKYNLYTTLPKLHITLEVVDEPNLDALCIALGDILKKYKSFSANINGAICFKPPFKSVNLKVDKTGTILEVMELLNSELRSLGFNVREDISNWDLHISLANANFSTRDWSTKEFENACTIVRNINLKSNIKIPRIEIWKPVNDKDEMVVKSYEL